MMRGVDVLVFDIQDIGTRFYTYICTMNYVMAEAARRQVPFMVLDRPNPITGVRVEGPVLEAGLESFTGCHPLPLRHGMTIGELARMMNEEQKLGAPLEVVAMRNWQRGDWFDATGLSWVNPSPNMRSLAAAILYPGVGMLERSTNYSVGRGTDAPFEQIGADWINGSELAAYLNARRIPGVRVYPTRFRPTASNFARTLVEGVRFFITARDVFNSTRLGLEIASALEALYPGRMSPADSELLIGSRATIRALRAGEDPRAILLGYEDALREFLARRERFLLYR
jgi:uncharacterized protein YbbC (DUF1343 family)